MRSFFQRLLGRSSEVGFATGMAADLSAIGRRLIVFTEHFNATYFISFDSPLRELHARGMVSFRAYDQQMVTAGGIGCWRNWIDSFRPEVVFLTRFGLAEGVDIVMYCRMRGIPVVYHIDDNLLDLPDSLGPEIVKRQGAAAKAREQMMLQCDLIYASTPVLAAVLKARFADKPVFHGIYAAAFEVHVPCAQRDAPMTIGYMGSKGHREDLAMVVPALVDLMEARPTLRFETFGTIEMPQELRRFGERVRHHTVQKAYREFLQTLAGLHWTIGLAPLVDEPFNQCKAPTKFIEYTCCGIPVVASDVITYRSAIWDGTGILVNDDWLRPLEALLQSPVQRRMIQQSALIHCKQVFSTSKLQSQVMDVVGRAISGSS